MKRMGVMCRYCLEEEEDIDKMAAPCKCGGWRRWIHYTCFDSGIDYTGNRAKRGKIIPYKATSCRECLHWYEYKRKVEDSECIMTTIAVLVVPGYYILHTNPSVYAVMCYIGWYPTFLLSLLLFPLWIEQRVDWDTIVLHFWNLSSGIGWFLFSLCIAYLIEEYVINPGPPMGTPLKLMDYKKSYRVEMKAK